MPNSRSHDKMFSQYLTYMSAHVLLNLLNELRKKIRCDVFMDVNVQCYDLICIFNPLVDYRF